MIWRGFRGLHSTETKWDSEDLQSDWTVSWWPVHISINCRCLLTPTATTPRLQFSFSQVMCKRSFKRGAKGYHPSHQVEKKLANLEKNQWHCLSLQKASTTTLHTATSNRLLELRASPSPPYPVHLGPAQQARNIRSKPGRAPGSALLIMNTAWG